MQIIKKNDGTMINDKGWIEDDASRTGRICRKARILAERKAWARRYSSLAKWILVKNQ